MATQVDETSRTQTHEHRQDDTHEHRHEHRHDRHSHRPIRELLKMLRDETAALFRYQAMLAKAETTEKAHIAGRNSITVAIGGALLFAGLIFLLLALRDWLTVFLITMGTPLSTAMWLSPLIVGIITVGIGAILVKKGLYILKHETWIPERTIHTIKNDEEWLRDKIH